MPTQDLDQNSDHSNYDPSGARTQAKSAGSTHREWLGLRQLAQYADVSERTLRAWIYSRRDPLPAAKVSGKVLVRKADFDRYLERHRVKPLHEIDLDGIVQEVLRGAAYGR